MARAFPSRFFLRPKLTMRISSKSDPDSSNSIINGASTNSTFFIDILVLGNGGGPAFSRTWSPPDIRFRFPRTWPCLGGGGGEERGAEGQRPSDSARFQERRRGV